MDLVKKNSAKQHHDDIKRSLQGTIAENFTVIPISSELKSLLYDKKLLSNLNLEIKGLM